MAETWNEIVLDTSAFLKSETEMLRKLCNNLWTIEEVLAEVRDESSRSHMDFALITSNVRVRRPKPESMDFVVAFSKKTGDFPALSKTDLMVLALTHELRGHDPLVIAREIQEEEEKAAAEAAARPVIDMTRMAQPGKSWASVLAPSEGGALSMPPATVEGDGVAIANGEEEATAWPSLRASSGPREKPVAPPVLRVVQPAVVEEEEYESEEEEELVSTALPPNNGNTRILSLNSGVGVREEDDEENDGKDDEWAKPGSMATGWGASVHKVELPPCTVGCATADFAVQNVLLQLRLGVVSLDGKRVDHVKSWVLKCDGCLAILPANQQRLFCPKCGHNALARLAFSIDSEGVRRYHYAKNRRIKNKGIRFPIPKGADLLLREDQLIGGKWAQRAQKKTDEESQWGRDVNDALGLGLKGLAKVQVGYGAQNPNATKGRERRGAAKKKRG
ncbi:hypothetical protein BASA81_002756 [Batrachochytrium salamandrivorans]|nr:hypothetical protein BASA81_002756 [Batrachochytrium salamandrivorans]